MYLILSPADIVYLTGVSVHEVGEVLAFINIEEGRMKNGGIEIMNNDEGIMNNEGIIFCDARTGGLFDTQRFEIIAERSEWEKVLGRYETLHTDPDHLTQTLREQIEGYGPRLIMAPSPITEQRTIKTPEEIRKLRASQDINRAVFEAIQPSFQVGVTEESIARKIQILQLELGASGPSFPPIVAFGEHSAIPHHSPTQRALQEGDVILIDMGVMYQGYCSDMTRCFFQKKKEESA